MAVKPHDILDFARQIFNDQKTEIGERASVGRAYYAAYHIAKEFHNSLGSPGSVGQASGSHEQLISQLTHPTIQSTDPKHLLSRRIGALLKDALRNRILADYKISDSISPECADSTIRTSTKIFELVSPPAKAPAPEQM